MNRNNDNEISSLVISLALKTLRYSVVLGALLVVLLFMLFPALPESFYQTAGNAPLSYVFAKKATGDNSSPDRLILTADKAISLMVKEDGYSEEVEKYCESILKREDCLKVLKQIDQKNLSRVVPLLHVNLCDSVDYYSTKLYAARLNIGKTTLFLEGADVEIIDLGDYISSAQPAEIWEGARLFNQLSLYVENCAAKDKDNKMDKLGVNEFYSQSLNDLAKRIDIAEPSLQDLFLLKAYYRYSDVYNKTGGESIGAITSITSHPTVKELYSDCLKNYKN